MGTINSNGIFVYDDTESLSPLSSYMNLQGSALSTRLAQDIRFKKVANEAARTSYVNEVGIANISAANPLAVYRQNAPEGLRFEVTYNGTSWDPIPSKSYFDAQDTGWTTIPPATGYIANTAFQVRRIGQVVYWRGRVTKAGGNFAAGTLETIATGVPSQFLAASYAHMIASVVSGTSSSASAYLQIDTGGNVQLRAQAAGTDFSLRPLSGYTVG